jgi:hypothetical protein
MFLGLLAACSSNAPDTRSDLLDPDGWSTMLTTGIAVAPVAGSTVVSGSSAAAAFFSDELDAALRNALPGTPIISSDEVYARLEDAGDNAHARLRSLRRRLVRDLELDVDELTAISRDIDERFLLVVLTDEGAVEGLQRTQLDDLQAFSYSMGTHAYPTGELRGQAIGFLIDLDSAARVWEARVSYESENLASRQSDAAKVIEDTRSDAIFRLTEALAIANRQG